MDVFRAIRTLGIRLLRFPFAEESSLEGAYRKRLGIPYIFVNSARWPRRQRFTAAHELGHHFLGIDRDFDHVDMSPSGSAQYDRPADWFAAHFLIDESSLASLLRSEHDPLRKALLAMQEYDVSLPAVAIHLADLGEISPDDKQQILTAVRDPSTTLQDIAAGAGVSLTREPRPDNTRELGDDYLAALSEIRGLGYLSDERFSEMANLQFA